MWNFYNDDKFKDEAFIDTKVILKKFYNNENTLRL